MFKHFRNPSAIPEQMRHRAQFVLWKYVERNGKTTKAPFQTNGKWAKSNDPKTWTKLENLLIEELFRKYHGIGFCFAEGDKLVGIDLDKCIEPDGSVSQWAKEILELFHGTYVEKTPSGKGFHIICNGKAVQTGTKKWDNGSGFEIYDYTSPRYFTVTGEVMDGKIIDCQEALKTLHIRYFPQDETRTIESKPMRESVDRSSLSVNSDADLDEILAALDYVNADEYSVWLDIGMAIKSAGLPVAVWDTWSQKSAKWDPDCCHKKWKGINPSSISVKTIFHYAVAGGFDKAEYLRKSGRNTEFHTGYTVKKIKSSPEPAQPEAPAELEAPKIQPAITKVATVESLESVEKPEPEISEDFIDESADQSADDSNVVDIETKSVFKRKPGNPITHPRWSTGFVPFAYQLNDKGLAKLVPDKNPEVISGPIHVVAMTSSADGQGGGLVVEFQNKKNKFLTLPIPLARLHEEPRLLAQDLASWNFYIQPGKEKDLIIYLANCNPSEDRIAVNQIGWTGSISDPEKLVFVWQDSATEEGYHFLADRSNATNSFSTVSGSLNDWIDEVFNPFYRTGVSDPNPYPLLMILSSLSSTLLKFTGMSTGGFHFYGGSSSGKTTLLQIAASVHGCGADPGNASGRPYIKRWNTTLNALEALAAAHNDMPLVMDELGSVDGKNFSRMIYDLSGGQGKSAMDASRNLKRSRTWLTTLISSGEISSQCKLEETNYGRRVQAKAGALIRMIDIEVKDQIFSSRKEVEKAKAGCSKFYGTLGPAFIKALANTFPGNELIDLVQVHLERSLNRVLKNYKNLNPIQIRALKYFALCEVAGLLLVHFKLIPSLKLGLVQNAIDAVVKDWIPTSATLSDAERSIVSLRDYILKYRESRFKTVEEGSTQYNKHDSVMQQISGYFDAGHKMFYLLPETFAEATAYEIRTTAKLLRDRGFLKSDRPDRNVSRTSIDGQRIAVYAIKADLIGES